MRKTLMIVVVWVIIMVLAACGSDDDDGPSLSSGSSNRRPTVTVSTTTDDAASPTQDATRPAAPQSPLEDLPEPVVDNPQLPMLDIDGGLLVVLYRELWYIPFHEADLPPTRLAESMTPLSVEVSPDGRYAVFAGGSEVSRNSLLVYDMQTLERVNAIGLSNNSRLGGWSLDANRLSILNLGGGGVTLHDVDGTYQSDGLPFQFDAAIMTDGSVINLDRSFENNAFTPLSLTRFDPDSGTLEPLNITVDQDPVLSIFDFEDELAELGYTFAPGGTIMFGMTQQLPNGTRLTIQFPTNPSATGICDTWTIRHSDPAAGSTEVAYTAEDTHSLSDLNTMPDGSFLVLRWYRSQCSISQNMMAELVRVYPDGSVESITDTVMADEGTLNLFNNNERHYTVSPDGRYVVWISKDVNSNTALEIRDLEAGIAGTLAIFTPAFGRDILQSVTWVGAE